MAFKGADAYHQRRIRHARTRTRATRTRINALVRFEGPTIEFRVARELISPNKWRAHWAKGHQLMKWWHDALTTALVAASGSASRARFLSEGGFPKQTAKVRVEVIRQVPSRRNFIRDDDDLRYTTKPLNDALKHAGLIRDDNRKWMEQGMPVQELAPDGHYWTIVRITPVDRAPVPAPSDPTIEQVFGGLR